jgi:hypothetical protein
MKKILFFSLLSLFLGEEFKPQTNPGFETGNLTGWTKEIDASGTESISTSNVRTGSFNMSYTTNTATTQRMEENTGLAVANDSYLHVLAWVVGSNSSANGTISIYTTGWLSASNTNIGTSMTRLSYKRQNTTGSSSTLLYAISCSRNTGGGSTLIYWDDVVAYVSNSSTTDVTDPNAPSAVFATSNAEGTSITVTWTDGTDAATGSQQAIVLRKTGLNQTLTTLNDQARYSTGGGSDGPNTVDSWTVVGIVGVGTETFEDNTVTSNTEYTYAVYMRDLAYNYSSGASSSVTALPVELTSFLANVFNSKVELNWTTATEVSNYGFEIERKVKNSEWEKIGFVNGHGNSNVPNSYTYFDNPLGGLEFQYRLKQIDFDGTFEYSYVIDVELKEIEQITLEQNYPNPFNPSTIIRFSIPKAVHVNLKVFNLLGEEVAELLNEPLKEGYHQIKFDGSKLTSGVYIYHLQAGEFKSSKKLLLMK